MTESAGILLFRKINGYPEFFLVHPGGPYFTKRNEGWWTVPKGEINNGEEPLACAIREFREETGFGVSGDFIELKPITQKAGKVVHCWALEFDIDAGKIISNTFKIEWPPNSGSTKSFPEIDKARWFEMDEAKLLINERQADFLTELAAIIKA
ncbi:MAG: NUDIX domain-containing protein [Chitinophagaceae bacterium]|jgi:predicted NUDIX family NTP pyrophosphohydrolase